MTYAVMSMGDNILEVKNLCVSFGGREVVSNLNYELRRGTTLGIVGESGSGKSVSSMALMGLLPAKATVSGNAWLASDQSSPADKTDLLSLDEEGYRAIRGKRISMIFQEPMTSLNPVQKCGAQVLEMLTQHQHGNKASQRQQVIELFKEVLLPRPEKIFDSYPHELSGGQKQRVMIAMALIANPDILIADEPTTALDVMVQKTILDLLKSLQARRGLSIIFITHDLGVIGQIADDILVMYRGKAVEHGPASEILCHPQQPYTRGLLACRPPLDSRPRRLPTVEEFLNGDNGNNGKNDDSVDYHNNASSSGQPLISVSDLDVTYTLKRSLFGRPLQTLKGVDGISFDIMEGETLGLVGESGCGKTTLGRALLQLIEHSSGSVVYRGMPLDSLGSRKMRALRPKLQIIFQDPYSSLNPRMTIGEAICEPLRVHHGKMKDARTLRERVVELMEQVGLSPDWYHRYPHELSGGQRQRVCIARALILQPELVVCDESVSALDVSVQAQVLNLLNDLKERYGLTYLFITHDLSVVHYLADRIMVMQKGRVVESGTPDELFRHPQTEYTKTLIEAIPRI
ncbi:MAG: ABC transporter ATP-binding protein [Bacteroidales bacterium]|nr:ABC transporter ATP-binding protein [Bacteroidales bacterium]